MVMKLRHSDQEGKEGDMKVCHVWKLLNDTISGYSCGWPFSDDDWLERSQAFSSSIDRQWKWHWLRLSWVFVSEYLCSTVSFHDIMPSFMFSISSPTFGLLHSSMGLYPLIDFPIESETWEQRGTDSIHCFHLCDTMMISPAATCQPPLLCSH